jgi:hypothetical protein
MKRIVLMLLFSMLIFFGCGEKTPYLVSITNGSSKPVTYNFYKFTDTLNASQSKTYEVWEPYVGPPRNAVDGNGIASIAIDPGITGNYTFTSAPSLNLNVKNELSYEIKIKAGNYIDKDNSTELTISPNSTVTTGATIYTKNPVFSSNSNYPITIEWNIVGNTMYVIIGSKNNA